MTDEQRKQIDHNVELYINYCKTMCGDDFHMMRQRKAAWLKGAEFGLCLSADRVKELEKSLEQIKVRAMFGCDVSCRIGIEATVNKLLNQSDNDKE